MEIQHLSSYTKACPCPSKPLGIVRELLLTAPVEPVEHTAINAICVGVVLQKPIQAHRVWAIAGGRRNSRTRAGLQRNRRRRVTGAIPERSRRPVRLIATLGILLLVGRRRSIAMIGSGRPASGVIVARVVRGRQPHRMLLILWAGSPATGISVIKWRVVQAGWLNLRRGRVLWPRMRIATRGRLLWLLLRRRRKRLTICSIQRCSRWNTACDRCHGNKCRRWIAANWLEDAIYAQFIAVGTLPIRGILIPTATDLSRQRVSKKFVDK